ncbi:MAG TPA: hypothetical protein VG325_10070 [Solirubrobacteraceae bacterium]|nr:hypothetical protein [Solirubrobacteraceae bacterium]
MADGAPRELLEAPPTATVARFLGYDGHVLDGGEWLLTRPPHVVLDPAGPLEASVVRAMALEDGFRLELTLANGRLFIVCPLPAPRVGDTVRLRIAGGARFARSAALDERAVMSA